MTRARAFASALLPLLVLATAGCGGSAGSVMTPAAPAVAATAAPAPAGPPNVIVILADDLGYGDLSCFGAPRIKTPNLDRLATEGVRFSDFRTTSPLCTPSRASLITGLYPPTTGLVGNLPAGPPETGVTQGEGSGGIDDDEITIADAFKAQGYRTAAIGKWHLGHQVQYLPMRHGFDTYYGMPSGEDPVLWLRGETPIRNPAEMDGITRAYTEEAISIIRASAGENNRPFFIYLAHKAPHVTLAPAPEFFGRSAEGIYGDVVEELDWWVGEIVKALKETGLDRNTVIWFMSDNGPWLSQGSEGGSPGALQGGKGGPYEGGLRVPAIAWWPAGIRGGRVVDEPVSVIDVFPTLVSMAGGQLSPVRRYPGTDLRPLLSGAVSRLPGTGLEGNRELLGYVQGTAAALRVGRWKYLEPGFWSDAPSLFDLHTDLAELRDLSQSEPDVARTLSARLQALADELARSGKRQKK